MWRLNLGNLLTSKLLEIVYLGLRFNVFFKCFSVYSNFKVGAAIRLLNGTIVGGCNIENSAFSPTICAERTAACKAISTGHTEFKAVAVIGPQGEAFTTPCGVCRQFLSEFVKNDIPIYVTKPNPNQVLITSLKSLLPMSFNLNDHPRA